MDEQKAIRHVSPLIADAFERLQASVVRLNKELIKLQNREAALGFVTREEVRRMIEMAKTKYNAE